MPLASTKAHTFQGLADNVAVTTGFDQQLGTAAVTDDLGGGEIVLRFADIATGNQSQYADTTAGDTRFVQQTFDFGLYAHLTSACEIGQARNATAKISNILLNVASGVTTVVGRGGGDTALFTAVSLATGVRYMAQMACDAGTTTTNGRTKVRITRKSDGVIIAEGELTGLNNGNAVTDRSNIGKLTATGVLNGWVDNIAVNDAAYAYLASSAPATNQPPTVSLAASQTADVEPGTTITLTVTAADSDGTIASRSITQAAGPTVTLTSTGTNTWTFRAPAVEAGTTVSFTATATDNSGASTTSTAVSVVVLPHNEWTVNTVGGPLVPVLIQS